MGRRMEPSLVSRIHSGMAVRSSDGVTLGRVAEVWCGTDPKDSTEQCDDAVCSRLEVRPSAGLLGRLMPKPRAASGRSVLFIPCGSVADVSGRIVALAVTAEDAANWAEQPQWIRKARLGLAPSTAAERRNPLDGSGYSA